jgi:hypothetical protein
MPEATTENCPAALEESAPNKTFADWPAATENTALGFDVTPAGTPDRVTCTLPVNPFCEVIEIATGALVVPCATLSDAGKILIEKSAAAGRGWAPPPPPPPQPTVKLTKTDRPKAHAQRMPANMAQLPVIAS